MSLGYNASLIQRLVEEEGVITPDSPLKQALDILSQVAEIVDALEFGDKDMLARGMGSLMVGVIIMATRHNLDLSEILRLAYVRLKTKGN